MVQNTSAYSIQFGFDGDSLFGQPEPHHFYDLNVSAEAYAQLCREQLKFAYPSVKDDNIHIVYRYDEERREFSPNVLHTDVFDEDGYSLGVLEIQNVDDICRDVQEQKRWVKQDAHDRLKDACRKSQLPASVIRWACQNNLISEVVRFDGEYWFRQADFAAFQITLKQFTSFEIVAIGEADEGQLSISACYDKSFWGNESSKILSKCIALLVQLDDEDIPVLLNQRNSAVTVWSRNGKSRMQFDLFTDLESWHHEKWSFEGFASTLIRLAHHHGFIESEEVIIGNSGRRQTESVSIILPFEDHNLTFKESITNCLITINNLIQDARSQTPIPPEWSDAFLHNENLFCENYLDLLLRRMGFSDVNYRGKKKRKEYGKDFTFTELSVLQRPRYYGLQAKDGNLSGEANSAIDKIIGQIDDAFTISYTEPSDPTTTRYISEFIVAISGYFKEDAEVKILQKVPEDRRRYVHFWNGDRVRQFVAKYFSIPQTSKG